MPRRPGRSLDTLSRRSNAFRERVEKLSLDYGYDIIESLIEQALGLDADLFRGLEASERANLMVRARERLLEYTYPKLKAIETEQLEPTRVIVEDRTSGARSIAKAEEMAKAIVERAEREAMTH